MTESPALTGDMAIVYLPDLDEQYAIKSCNIVAKSSIGLAFKNGSELVEVDGDHDSTTVAVSLLQQIQGAIGVAQSVEQARIQHNSKALGAGQTGAKAAKADTGAKWPAAGLATCGAQLDQARRLSPEQAVGELRRAGGPAGRLRLAGEAGAADGRFRGFQAPYNDQRPGEVGRLAGQGLSSFRVIRRPFPA